MWAHHRRVIWLCLTKQHSQTQKFLLRLFSHHWSEAVARGVGGGGWTERQNKTERSGAERERKHFFGMKWNTITRETCFSKRERKKQFMQREKEAEISWSEKFMISSEMSSAWSSGLSWEPEVPWPDWLSAWHWDAWLAVAHSTF